MSINIPGATYPVPPYTTELANEWAKHAHERRDEGANPSNNAEPCRSHMPCNDCYQASAIVSMAHEINRLEWALMREKALEQ